MQYIRKETHEVKNTYIFNADEIKTILLNHIKCNGIEKNIRQHHSVDIASLSCIEDGLYELTTTYKNNPSKWEVI